MARFLIDEDLPKAVAQALSAAGHDARGVRDGGLQGSPDAEIHAFATGNGLVLVTADLGLADPFRYPPEHGTVLVRLPNSTPASEIGRRVATALAVVDGDEFASAIVVVEPNRVRVRRIGV
jgi:predicted nuclease of predicted toxin-antitoxin system